MAKPGPKRQSAQIIRMRGNRSKLSDKEIEQREAAEVKPHPAAPSRPTDLSPLERECWDLHAPELEHLGLLTVLDGASFRLLVCQPYELAAISLEEMRARTKTGAIDRRRKNRQVVVDDEAHGGKKRHPAFLTWKQSVDLYRAGCHEFGLTPASRVDLRPGAPVGAEPDDEDDDNAFFGS